MQLTVNVRPYYKKNIESVYPKITSNLSRLNASLVEEDPSIFDLVGKLDKLLYASDGNPALKDILLKYQNKLRDLHKEVQDHIADWKLAEADRALYKIEDIFDEIEWELDKL
jgi:hypothetical protein